MAEYVIQRGDTLSALAKRWGVTVQDILDANPDITDPNRIYAGDTLTKPGGGSSGGNSTGGGGSTGPTVGSTANVDLVGIGGQPEIWYNSDSGQYLVVYYIPDTEPPVPYYYTATEQEIKGAFGPQQDVVVDRHVTDSDLQSFGAVTWGQFEEINPDIEDPFADWANEVTAQAAVRPWLRDPEVLALIAEAMVEGRSVSDAELEQTTWWREHNDAERAWMLLYESDPQTAQQQLEANRLVVEDRLRDAGVDDPPEAVVDFITRQFTEGHWSDPYTIRQIEGLADPAADIEIDPELADILANPDVTINTTQENEQKVRDLVLRWLGPTYGNWSPDQVAKWAGKLRNDPDGETQLVDMLRSQRLTLFSAYDNPALTYEDIAGPWKTVWMNEWGSEADETDPLFTDILAKNDLAYARSRLRKEGLKRNNATVVGQMLAGLNQVTGGQVRSFL